MPGIVRPARWSVFFSFTVSVLSEAVQTNVVMTPPTGQVNVSPMSGSSSVPTGTFAVMSMARWRFRVAVQRSAPSRPASKTGVPFLTTRRVTISP